MKKRFAFFLALILLLSACGKAPVGTAGAYPDTVIIREPTEDNPLQFDFYEALNNIYIAETKVSFPRIITDLGEGFRLEGMPLDVEGGGLVADGLRYNGVDVGGVILEGTADNYDDSSKIVHLMLSAFDENSEQHGIYTFRVGDVVSHEDIIAYFGVPTAEGKHSLVYELEESKKHIKFLFNTVSEEQTLLWVAISMF